MNIQFAALMLFSLCLVSCTDTHTGKETGDNQALERASALVADLKQAVETDYEMSAEAWDGVPVISMTVWDSTFDFASAVEQIKRAVGSFEGELWLAFQRPMGLTESDKAAGVKDGKMILAKFDAKTGERLP